MSRLHGVETRKSVCVTLQRLQLLRDKTQLNIDLERNLKLVQLEYDYEAMSLCQRHQERVNDIEKRLAELDRVEKDLKLLNPGETLRFFFR